MKNLKRYGITLLIGFVITGLILWSKGIFTETDAVTVFHILCDAFFVTGVVITGVGLLVLSTNEGTFDILVFGMQSFMDMFRKEPMRKYETFYDYRASRQEKKVPFGFILVSGLFFLLVSMAMYLMYLRYI